MYGDVFEQKVRVTMAVFGAYVDSYYISGPSIGKGYEYLAAIDKVKAQGVGALSYEEQELLTELTREFMTIASGMMI